MASETKKFRPADDNDPAATSAIAADASEQIPGRNTAMPRGSANSAVAQGKTAPEVGRSAPPGPSATGAASGELQPLLEQLDRLARQQPRGNTQAEQLEDLVRIHSQRLNLAKQALQLKPDEETRRRLVMAMHEIHQVFVQLRVGNATTQLVEFGKTMTADADPEVARIGRHALFSANISRVASQPLEDGKAIAAEAKKLLDAERGRLNEATLELVGQTADMLTGTGFKNDAVAVIEMLAEALAADPKLADQAPKYALVAKVVKADLDTLVNNVIREQPGADAKIEAAVQTLLDEVPTSRELLLRTQTVAHILESTGHYQAAQACFDKVSAAFADVKDEALAEDAKNLAPKARQRMALVGQPFAVEGVTVDGKAFDWSPYAGKVVLVDFWASWCGPCIEELPNIRQNFEQFHAKGFEVVGVNLNTSLADVKQFLALQDLPWATVTSQAVLDGEVKEEQWKEIPMAARCGVDGIPFVILIGKDGKVDSIHVRGSKLRNRLTQLLGEPITTEVPADPTQPAAPPVRPATGKQSKHVPPRGTASPLAAMLTGALFAADPAEPAVADDTAINPYRAKPNLTSSQLVAFIQKMLDRPQAIQTRPGFAEAIVEACDSVLAADPKASHSEQLVAIESKFAVLHREASDGKEAADQQLMAFVEQLKDDSRTPVAHEVEFYRLERRVLDAKDLPLDEIRGLLKEVQSYAAKEKLTAKHLRLASSTVAAINRLENGDEREAQFAALGNLLAKSSDKELARYGKKLAKKSASEESPTSR